GYDPVKESERWAAGLDYRAGDILVVTGFGLGYHIRHLLKRNPENTLVVVEPRLDLFIRVLEAVDITDILSVPNFYLIVEEEVLALKNKTVLFFNVGEVDKLQIYYWPAYQRIFPEFCREVGNAFLEVAKHIRITENTILFFSQLWPENVFYNLTNVVRSPGVNQLFGKFEGQPAIIISAGPSLNKNCELLKEAKGKAVLICVDTALKTLLKHDIHPDLLVALDGSELNCKHFEGIDIDDVPLIFLPTTHHKIVNEYKGAKFSIGAGNDLINWISKHIDWKGAISYSGSVATAAFDVAARMGANPIIFVGQDLAYSGGKTHADGTIYEGKRVDEYSSGNKFYIEDIEGKPVLTDLVLYSFLQWFENMIRLAPEGKVFIDATEGGARIKGTRILTLREVLDRYCQDHVPVQESLREIFENYEPPEEESLLSSLETAISSLQKLKKTSSRALKTARKLHAEFTGEKIHGNKVNKLLAEIDRCDQEVKAEEAHRLTQIMLQPVLLSVMKGPLAQAKPGETEQEFGKRVAKRTEFLYQGIEIVCRDMARILQKTLDDLRGRRE
nr:DUF115 domain-containing protein [Clostridia bacterium]